MATLSKYRSLRLAISAEDAHRVLTFYFRGRVPQLGEIDENDRRFAQALILEAAEASARIGMIEALWRKAASPAVRPLGVLKVITRQVLHYLNRPTDVQSALDSPNYDMVLNQIAYNFSRTWEVRVQTGDSSMLL